MVDNEKPDADNQLLRTLSSHTKHYGRVETLNVIRQYAERERLRFLEFATIEQEAKLLEQTT